jgi:hypothetical protein
MRINTILRDCNRSSASSAPLSLGRALRGRTMEQVLRALGAR